MIDRATIEQVMETTNIVDVVSDFVALKRRGANYVACCPFHSEKTPSFYVSATKGIYKCFGCGKSGNAVTFLREHEQMSYVEAIKYLGAKYGIEVEDKIEDPQELERRQKRESLLIVTEYAQRYFSDALLQTKEGETVGLSYFSERKITEQSIKEFGLGYADSLRDSFTKAALASGYKKEHLIETGLTKIGYHENPESKQKEEQLYDGYRERVIFPIRNISGRVVAFGGRKLRSDNNLAKYINSPESDIYIKNKTLYGLFEAKKNIEKNDCCYLVEGYTDVIQMAQKGVRNIVASCGTSLTQGQIQLIRRFTNNIVVLYDGDSAGIHASLRGIDMFLTEGFNVKVVLLPEGEDPDSFARSHSEEEVHQFLENSAEDFIAFKCRLANSSEMQNNPVKKSEFVHDISRSISVIPDSVLRNLFAAQVSQTLNIPINALSDQIAQLRAAMRKEQSAQRVPQNYDNPQKQSAEDFIIYNTQNISPLYKFEKEIIYYLLKFGTEWTKENVSVANLIKAHLDYDDLKFEDASFRKIYEEYFSLPAEKTKDAIKYFSLKTGEDAIVSKVVIDIFDEKYTIRSDKIKGSIIDEKIQLSKVIPQIMLNYKAQICQQRINDLLAKIEDFKREGKDGEELKLLEEINRLNRAKKELLKKAKEEKF